MYTPKYPFCAKLSRTCFRFEWICVIIFYGGIPIYRKLHRKRKNDKGCIQEKQYFAQDAMIPFWNAFSVLLMQLFLFTIRMEEKI